MIEIENSIYSIIFADKTIKIDLTNDRYGKEFWEKVESNDFEPAVRILLSRILKPNSIFMDIGAANGVYTLLGAALGAKVYSYEPEPEIFKVLTRNISLNSNISGLILAKQTAVGAESSLRTNKEAEKYGILTKIAQPSAKEYLDNLLSISSLAKDISLIQEQNKELEYILKIDIEGAEWNLFKDQELLRVLEKVKAKVVIALHPGFTRPNLRKNGFLSKYFKIVANILIIIDVIRFYNRINKYASIKRIDLEQVPNKSKMLALVLGNYFEFIIQFE